MIHSPILPPQHCTAGRQDAIALFAGKAALNAPFGSSLCDEAAIPV
jgi:hypothetical protein